jgi:hypothetical protein
MINKIIMIIILIGVFILQSFFSKSKLKWPGLIFPILFFIISIIFSLRTLRVETGILAFIIYNIPTLLLSIIYYIYYNKKKNNTEIDKMNIQDL